MSEVSATEFIRNFGKYSEEGQREPIAITNYGRVSGYYISAIEYREYERIKSQMPQTYKSKTSPNQTPQKLTQESDDLNDLDRKQLASGTTLDALRHIKPALNQLVTKYGGKNLRVFGSVARREDRPDSDVDLLVELPKVYDLFGQRIPLARELQELIGRKVDLLPDNEISKRMRDSILEDAVEL